MNKIGYWLSGATGALCLFTLWNLYQTKQQSKLIQYHIAQVQKETLSANAHTAMLKMEWGVLNQPERLEELSKRFLPNLRPTEAIQFAQLDQASARLPSTYATARLNQHTMLADKRSAAASGSNGNIALARNTITPSVVAHEEDGSLESAINDLEKNETEEHIHALPVAQASSRHVPDASYDKLLTAFQQNPSVELPSAL